MKKMVLSALTLSVLAFGLVSCGGGASQEEIDKKAEEMLTSKKAELDGQIQEKCNAMVAAKVDSLRNLQN